MCVFHVCAGVHGGKKLPLGVFFSVAILFFETGSHTEAGAHQSNKTSQPTRHRDLHLFDSPAWVLQAHAATPSITGGWGSLTDSHACAISTLLTEPAPWP